LVEDRQEKLGRSGRVKHDMAETPLFYVKTVLHPAIKPGRPLRVLRGYSRTTRNQELTYREDDKTPSLSGLSGEEPGSVGRCVRQDCAAKEKQTLRSFD